MENGHCICAHFHETLRADQQCRRDIQSFTNWCKYYLYYIEYIYILFHSDDLCQTVYCCSWNSPRLTHNKVIILNLSLYYSFLAQSHCITLISTFIHLFIMTTFESKIIGEFIVYFNNILYTVPTYIVLLK